MFRRDRLVFLSLLALTHTACVTVRSSSSSSNSERTIAAATYASAEPTFITICTFNVYILGSVEAKYLALDDESVDDDGASVPTGVPPRISSLAAVLTTRQLDLIVIEEVTAGQRGEAAIADLAATMHGITGKTYQHFISEEIGPGLVPEAIAFIYDQAVVQPELLPGKTTMVENIEIPGRDLVRTQWEAGDFDFTLIAGHLAWSDRQDRDDGYRKIDEIFKAEAPSQFSDDPDVIVLGDFNRMGLGYDSEKFLEFDTARVFAPNVTFFDPGFATKAEVTTTSIQGKGVPGDNPQFVSTTVAQNKFVYDMILVSRDGAEEFPPGVAQATYGQDFGVIVYDEIGGPGHQTAADGLAHDPLKKAFSDHRPLWIRFRTDTANADDGPGGTALTPPASNTFYVGTASGTRFHRPTCSTIKNAETPVRWETREAAVAARPPCGVCKP